MLTKEAIAAKAKELGLTLTDEQIEQLIKEDRLPEKPESKTGTTIEELVSKYSARQLAEMLVETRTEAKDRRLEARSLKEQAEALTKEINGLKDLTTKYPELETKYKGLEQQLQVIRDSEKKRRELILGKLEETKRTKVSYLLEVDKIGAEQFDSTVELLTGTKSSGADSSTPAGDPPKITLSPEQKQEADRMNLSEKDYLDVVERRKTRAPIKTQPQSVLQK